MAGLPLEAAWCFNPRSGTTAFRRYATAPALLATVTVPGVKSMKAPLLLLSIAAATFASTASARAGSQYNALSQGAAGDRAGRGRDRSHRGADARTVGDAARQPGPAGRAARQADPLR